MAMLPSNVVAALPELQWRALSPVPVEEAPYEFAHEQAERRYPYLDGAGHDHTGRHPIKITAKLLFLNTLAPKLYPAAWQDWRAALLDGSAGDLVHPDLGRLRARVLSGSVRLTAQARAGITVDVVWVETIDDPSKAPSALERTSVSLAEAAANADRACSALGIHYPRIQEPPSTSITGAFKSLMGSFFSAKLSFFGGINQVLGAVRQMSDAVELLASTDGDLLNPNHRWVALYNLHLVEEGLLAMLDRASTPARPVGSLVLEQSTTLDAAVKRTGNTVAELIELNPLALGKPSIPAGAVLRYYLPT